MNRFYNFSAYANAKWCCYNKVMHDAKDEQMTHNMLGAAAHGQKSTHTVTHRPDSRGTTYKARYWYLPLFCNHEVM
jgi:hypothetical protein